MMLKNDSLFRKVSDFFFVTEFQNRGNEHVHFMLWIQDAPVFGHCNNIDIEHFIDKCISSDSTLLDPNLVKMQTHHHTKTCKKYRAANCRFNFPFPPMRQTTILEPLLNVDPVLIDRSKLFFKQLETKHYIKQITFDNFLDEVQL